MSSDTSHVDADMCAAAPASKQPYRAPQLTCLGTLAEVTRTSANPSAGTDGGGSFPNVYSS